VAPDPLRFEVRPVLREPALVLALEGWSDAGESASTAARWIASALCAVPLAEIDPEEFYDFTVRRPEVAVADGQVERFAWPTTRFLYGAREAAGDLVVGLGIEPHLRWRAWSDEVLRLVRELDIRKVALLGAYLADVLYSRPVGVTAVASDGDLLGQLGLEPVRYAGPTGMLGLLGLRLREADCQVLSLWASLPHYIQLSPNARGALALVERAAPFLDLRFDVASLRHAAEECEQRTSALVSVDPELAEYVRELKRREFAQ
jgi:proteasome assembly chaperone (PAC2) family protein